MSEPQDIELGHLSHEVRNPLSAIVMAAAMLQDGNLDSRQQILARTISESADRISDLINGALNQEKLTRR